MQELLSACHQQRVYLNFWIVGHSLFTSGNLALSSEAAFSRSCLWTSEALRNLLAASRYARVSKQPQIISDVSTRYLMRLPSAAVVAVSAPRCCVVEHLVLSAMLLTLQHFAC